MKSKEEMKGFDFGDMMLESNEKGKFQNWNDIRVFEVCKSGIYSLKKKSSAGAWKWKWEHKLAPENYFPLPEKHSEAGFERLTMST